MNTQTRPNFASDLRPSHHRAIARARWVAEQHFVYELSNDADTILLSMRSHGPLTTAVMLPDPSGRLSLMQCRDREEQHAFYSRNRSKRRISAADISTVVGSDWYSFVSGSLTHAELSTGAATHSRFAGILPITDGEDTIAGELGFGLAESEVAAMGAQSSARRRAFMQVQQQWLAAINSGNLAQLSQLYAESAQLAERESPGTAQAACHGRSAIEAYYAGMFQRLGQPVVDVLRKCTEDWYAFAELVWEFEGAAGGIRRMRTATITSLDPQGRIAFQLGCATDLQGSDESTEQVRYSIQSRR
ncbi:MAG TPA: nuclear transport factor 2 family protein [Ramlibacter sp.]|nr:nuclear transport factor 2 family protein [Ramlibacter sp.]